MRLDSIRELKQTLQIRAMVEEGARHGELILAAGRPQAILESGPSIALGAAPTDTRGEYKLAVRVQREEFMHGPEVEKIAAAAHGEVDIAFVGPGFKQTGRESPGRARPLAIGCSIGHAQITAGTLGCFVDGPNGVRILSNNHVLADEDRARPGDPILQPGAYDGGVGPEDAVASLDQVVPLVAGAGNRMDAATAMVNGEVEYEPGVVEGLGPVADPVEIDGTERVAKVGRTTRLTRGRIAALDVDGVAIAYEKGSVLFDGVIEIAGLDGLFTEGGDSGSLVVTDEPAPKAVALHFGGLANGHSVAAPLPVILQELDVALVN